MINLDKIKTPKDIKNFNIKGLNCLASEIRKFLINSIAETGGHLSSNLGVTELTIALHYCFDAPKDKIIWDVGHQAYVHKILTGRKDGFKTLRKYKGLSGFPKVSESIYDCFDVGHSSTSISLGLGFAKSRDLMGDNYNVVSIIGDGSMSSGLAFEGLNNAGRADTNLIVVLNDNEMSISENVGAMSRHLNKIRTAPSYLDVKKDVHTALNKIPYVGKKLGKVIEKTKEGIKYFLISGILFEEFGFNYIGPIDGHDIEQMVDVFNKAKKMQGPVLLHVYTKKGKGYKFAEEFPERYHGVDKFNVETGNSLKSKSAETYSDILGKELVKIGNTNKKVVAITASMLAGTGLNEFKKHYPDRTFDVGIAESHAVTFAAAMAKNGLVPVFAVYSTFLQRAFDQIIHDVCILKLPVVFAIDRAGIVGADGETHQGIFDLSYLSIIPNMTALAPRNGYELREMLKFAVDFGAPVAVRYPRGEASVYALEENSPIEYAQSETVFKGEKFAIISVGSMFDEVYKAYVKLKENGYNPTLINARFIKPIDQTMVESLSSYDKVFIIEDNLRKGGFGINLLDEINKKGILANINLTSFPDEFIEQGSKDELFKQFGLDSESLYTSITNKLDN